MWAHDGGPDAAESNPGIMPPGDACGKVRQAKDRRAACAGGPASFGGGMMDITFFYWEDCMSHEEALQRLGQVMAEEGILAPIQLVKVETWAQAEYPRRRVRDQAPGSGHDPAPGVHDQAEMIDAR
jgi:hypothetical protein